MSTYSSVVPIPHGSLSIGVLSNKLEVDDFDSFMPKGFLYAAFYSNSKKK